MQAWLNVFVACLLVSAKLSGLLGAEIPGAVAFLEADGEVVLKSHQVELPGSSSDGARLSFEIGFGSDELIVPQFFSDSFSVSLYRPQADESLLLVTADAGGFRWAPANPGGIRADESSIRRSLLGDVFSLDGFQSAWSYHVSVPWPSLSPATAHVLLLDMFDNQNALASIGWIGSVEFERLESPELPMVYAASSVDGPFRELEEVIHQPVEGRIRIPREIENRFYRVRSPIPTVVTEIRREGSERVVAFSFLDPTPKVARVGLDGELNEEVLVEALGFGLWRSEARLEGEAGFLSVELVRGQSVLSISPEGGALDLLLGQLPVEGAVSEEGNFFPILPLSVAGEGVVLPVAPETTFLRVAKNSGLVIDKIERQNETLSVGLLQTTSRFELLEADSPDGPYQVDSKATLGFGDNAFRTPAEYKEQFYRLEGGEIVDIHVDGEWVLIHYQ